MKKILEAIQTSLTHLSALDQTFQNATILTNPEVARYRKVLQDFNDLLDQQIPVHDELYKEKGRQMILADVLEYAFLSRGANLLSDNQNKSHFIKLILIFVNLLMSYEDMTSEVALRKYFLANLASDLPQVANETNYNNLNTYGSFVGMPKTAANGNGNNNPTASKYFDTLLPKTAGGLWHELLVYIFMLRRNAGYIIPLLLHQRLFGRDDHLVPPDFLIIKNQKIFGIEVGAGKELQSSSFALKTTIPTVSVDTINSRTTDRCPICHKWIHFCDVVINNYSNMNFDLPEKPELRCIDNCSKFSNDEIYSGKCSESKYMRNSTKSIKHVYTNAYHYHYACVLKSLAPLERDELIAQQDKVALKTHYPYYSGIDELLD